MLDNQYRSEERINCQNKLFKKQLFLFQKSRINQTERNQSDSLDPSNPNVTKMVNTLIFPINEHQTPTQQQRNNEPSSILKASLSLSQTSLYSDCTNSNSNLSFVPSSSNSSYSVVSPSVSSSNMNSQTTLKLDHPVSNGKFPSKSGQLHYCISFKYTKSMYQNVQN